METQYIYFRLAPSYLCHRNGVKRVIFTFNNYPISGLCNIDGNFPLNLWDKFLPQCLITVNLISGYHINTNLSAYDQVHGAFDFNCTPLPPFGNQLEISGPGYLGSTCHI